MGKRLSCIVLTILISILLTTHTTYAATQTNDISFFSFLKNYIVAFNANDAYNKHVLAAQIKVTAAPQLPQPTLQIIPTQTISQTPQLSDVSAYILNGVNEYRSSLGLSSVQSSAETCSFASLRAQEIASSFTHTGFYNRVNAHTLPYTTWTRATENIAEAPDYKEVVTLWKNSPEHAANMRDNTPYVCIEQSGNYFAYEGMRP